MTRTLSDPTATAAGELLETVAYVIPLHWSVALLALVVLLVGMVVGGWLTVEAYANRPQLPAELARVLPPELAELARDPYRRVHWSATSGETINGGREVSVELVFHATAKDLREATR